MEKQTVRQVSALCWRKGEDGLEVLLVTSRETRRWVTPKGWPMKGLKDFTAAKQEAYEEAGVEGRIKRKPIGSFIYEKRQKDASQTVRVVVYALNVRKERKNWPEKSERKRQWFSPQEAARRVAEPGLKLLLSQFAG
jgi:8-oxo-dGTP pyrophosphatase MutT (NUDIX family)